MKPTYIDRPDLLDSPLFWRWHLAGLLEATDEDAFDSATEYFGFRCSDETAGPFIEELESQEVEANCFPAHFAYVSVKGKWLVGASLHAIPDEFEVGLDLVSPDGDRQEVGVVGGHFMLPAFRWKEVEMLAEAVGRS